MLVTFKTKSYADITMFGDVATSLLKMMGQSGSVPGAIMAGDVSASLQTLKENIARSDDPSAQTQINDDGEAARPVSLSTRASPLIELLESAIEDNANVVWEN